jgi:hypothetical protein
VPTLMVWVVLRAPRLAPTYAMGVAVLLLPFTLHNVRTSGNLILISDNGGVNLWLANTGRISGTFEMVDERFSDIFNQAQAAKQVAEAGAGRSLSPGEVSSWLARSALAEIVKHPRRFALRVAQRARALMENFETDIVSIPSVESTTIAPLRVLVLPFGVLAGLAAAAALLGARLTAGPRAPIWCVAGMVVVTTLMFFHYSRFRLPLVPILALSVGDGWERLRTGSATSIQLKSAALGFAAVLLISWQSAPHHAQTLANGWVSLGQARLALATPGDTAELEAVMADAGRALDASPGFARADLLAARTSLLLARYDDADAHLSRVERLLPDYAPVRLERALLAAYPDRANRHRDPERARRLLAGLESSADADPTVRKNLEQLRRYLEH